MIPELTLAGLAVLPLSDDANARQNQAIAAGLYGDVRLYAGEAASFNWIVGRRDCHPQEVENRKSGCREFFNRAPAFFDGRQDTQLGGGVCLVSTTIYLAAMRAGIGVVRAAHSRPVDYVGLGEDAAVNYPDLDLILSADQPTFVRVYTTEALDDPKNRLVAEVWLAWPDGRAVSTEWVTVKALPFGEAHYGHPQVQHPVLVDRGVEGISGYRVWWRGVPYRQEIVKSTYRSLPAIWADPQPEERPDRIDPLLRLQLWSEERP